MQLMKTMTLGDLDFFEKETGTPFTSFGEEGQPMAEAMIVLAGLTMYKAGEFANRREAVTAARDLTLDEIKTRFNFDIEEEGGEQQGEA